MKSWQVARFACVLGTLATLGWMLPAPAAADSVGTDAAIGAAVGTIIGQLLFDGNRQQYYYVHERRRCYVSNEQAWQYRRYHWHEVEYSRDWHVQHDWHQQRDWEHRGENRGGGDRGWGGDEHHDRDDHDRGHGDDRQHGDGHDRWERR